MQISDSALEMVFSAALDEDDIPEVFKSIQDYIDDPAMTTKLSTIQDEMMRLEHDESGAWTYRYTRPSAGLDLQIRFEGFRDHPTGLDLDVFSNDRRLKTRLDSLYCRLHPDMAELITLEDDNSRLA